METRKKRLRSKAWLISEPCPCRHDRPSSRRFPRLASPGDEPAARGLFQAANQSIRRCCRFVCFLQRKGSVPSWNMLKYLGFGGDRLGSKFECLCFGDWIDCKLDFNCSLICLSRCLWAAHRTFASAFLWMLSCRDFSHSMLRGSGTCWQKALVPLPCFGGSMVQACESQ